MSSAVPSATARYGIAKPAASTPSSLGRGSAAMLISIAIMAIGGFVFNAITARTVAIDSFGIYASLLFWVLLLNQLTSLGLPVTISRLGRFAVRSTGDWLMVRAFGLTIASSLVGTMLFWALAVPRLRDSVHDALLDHGVVVGFSAVFLVVSGLSLTLLVEIRLVGIGLAQWVVWRALAANVLRVGLLVVGPMREDPLGLLVINAGANALLGALVAGWLVYRRSRIDESAIPTSTELGEERRTALVNWGTIAAVQAPQFAVPVLANLSPESNASFYLAWQVMTVVFLAPVAIGHVVVIEGTGQSKRVLNRVVGLGVLSAATVGGVCAVLAIPLGRAITGLLFGEDYRSTGSLLPVLIAAAVPWSVTAVALSATRVDRLHVVNAIIAFGFALSALGIALLVPDNDAMATSRGWLIANMLAAVVSVVAILSSRRSRVA